ncbi:Alpha/Beta hydrolase protein [Mycena vitilis]|nr:Alpha/Beta hydrolase protein [Mycena vitilis]
MLTLPLSTPTGDLLINYVISTPTQASAPAIDPALPTVLFLHPVYLGKVTYHVRMQFADQELRRFNLVALDLRCHGETVGRAGEGYGQEVAARGVALFMSTLQIPRYHLFGMSMGGCIALQLATLFPESVLSIFVVSPLPVIEPPEVIAGLQEIYDCWSEDLRRVQDVGLLEATAMSADSFHGALQLTVNGAPTKTFTGVCRVTVPFAMAQWARVEQLDDFHAITVDFFARRRAHDIAALRRMAKCPVQLVHCAEDVAYPLAATEELAAQLRAAGVEVGVKEIEGAPQFGVVTHAKEINTLFNAFLLSVVPDPPPIPDHVESPFKAQFVAVGCDGDSDSDDDSEEGSEV